MSLTKLHHHHLINGFLLCILYIIAPAAAFEGGDFAKLDQLETQAYGHPNRESSLGERLQSLEQSVLGHHYHGSDTQRLAAIEHKLNPASNTGANLASTQPHYLALPTRAHTAWTITHQPRHVETLTKHSTIISSDKRYLAKKVPKATSTYLSNKITNQDPVSLLNKANNYYLHGQYSESLSTLDTAIKNKPNWAPLFVSRGLVLSKIGNTTDARKNFQRAQTLDKRLRLPG